MYLLLHVYLCTHGFVFRYLDLTEEEKEMLRGSLKVAKKLEKLENSGKDNRNSDSDSDNDENDNEYPSLGSTGSGTASPLSGKLKIIKKYLNGLLCWYEYEL